VTQELVPLVSVVTPTIPGREQELIDRCIPSVRKQSWGRIEHIIISDENPQLRHQFRNLLVDNHYFRFVEINNTWKTEATRMANGAMPWMLGAWLALGDYVSFLGDDDELLPDHIYAHVSAMQSAGAMWSLSKVEFRAHGEFWNVIGDDSFVEGHLDATGIMCKREALRTANWDPAAGIAAVDWKLVNDWRAASLPGVFIDKVTGIHHDGWLIGMTGKPYETKER
jgi:hypothetical protein